MDSGVTRSWVTRDTLRNVHTPIESGISAFCRWGAVLRVMCRTRHRLPVGPEWSGGAGGCASGANGRLCGADAGGAAGREGSPSLLPGWRVRRGSGSAAGRASGAYVPCRRRGVVIRVAPAGWLSVVRLLWCSLGRTLRPIRALQGVFQRPQVLPYEVDAPPVVRVAHRGRTLNTRMCVGGGSCRRVFTSSRTRACVRSSRISPCGRWGRPSRVDLPAPAPETKARCRFSRFALGRAPAVRGESVSGYSSGAGVPGTKWTSRMARATVRWS